MLNSVKNFLVPKRCYETLHKSQSWLGGISLLLFIGGLVIALFIAPPDYKQGDAYRIMFIHVPAALLSLFIYIFISIMVIIYKVWKIKVADYFAEASAPLGIMFTLITLITGAFWGRPMWGTYWIWDARLTSELILFFIYLGIIWLRASIPEMNLAAKASGLLTLVGLVNIPIIHFSVVWWNTLHQGPTLFKFSKPSIAASMLFPLLIMLLAFILFYAYLICLRFQTIYHERYRIKSL